MYKIINPSDTVVTDSMVALLFGEPGIGKTSLAFTTDNPLLLDFDSGVQRACYKQTAVKIDSWEDLIQFQNSKEFKELKPKSLLIDTVGTMLDNYLSIYVKGIDPKNRRRGGELSLQGYGAMKNAFTQFKNWAKSLKINLIFIAHVTSMDEGDNTKFIPKVTGGSYDILRQECDLIGYMYSNRDRRVIDFNPRDSHIGKNCAEFDELQIPSYLTNEYPLFFQDIIDQTLEKMNSLSVAQSEALKKVQDFKEGLDLVTDLETVENCFNGLSNEESRPVKIQMFSLLRDHADKLGIKWNSKHKKFEVE